MRFHFLMLLIVILVSLGMHGLASAGVSWRPAGEQMESDRIQDSSVIGARGAERNSL